MRMRSRVIRCRISWVRCRCRYCRHCWRDNTRRSIGGRRRNEPIETWTVVAIRWYSRIHLVRQCYWGHLRSYRLHSLNRSCRWLCHLSLPLLPRCISRSSHNLPTKPSLRHEHLNLSPHHPFLFLSLLPQSHAHKPCSMQRHARKDFRNRSDEVCAAQRGRRIGDIRVQSRTLVKGLTGIQRDGRISRDRFRRVNGEVIL